MAPVLTLARLSQDVYNDSSSGPVDGFRRIEGLNLARWSHSSFYGAPYTHGSTGVLAFRGSLEREDWTGADLSIGLGRFPIDQLGDAFALFNTAKRLFEGQRITRIIVTGHSLGGGLTQVVAAGITSVPVVGVSFNAPGMAGLRGPVRIPRTNERNVFNYRADGDPVSLHGAHLGRAPTTVDIPGSLVGSLARGFVTGGALGAAIGGARNAAEAHSIDTLVEALAREPAGSIRH